MLKRESALEPLFQMKSESEKNAAGRLMRLQAQLEGHKRSLAKMLTYQEEYTEQFERMKTAHMTQTLMHYFSHFLQHIERAIQSSGRQLALLEAEYQAEQAWCEARQQEVRAIRKIVKSK
jgi:flagellar export protein FliJ